MVLMIIYRSILFLRRRISCLPTSILVVMSLSFLPFLSFTSSASANEYGKGAAAIGAAFMTHLFLHEVGHQVVAEEAGAKSAQMQFFTRKKGVFYPGVSTYKSIKKESELSYATGGERMAGYTFEYALN